jgi:hypothetical protein
MATNVHPSRLLAATVILLSASLLCQAQERQTSLAASSISPRFCGGKLTDAVLRHYLLELNVAIAGGRIPKTFGPTRYGSMPSVRDWKAIAAAIEAGKLEDIGWRGCMLSHGKAAFESDGEGNFVLVAFDSQRAWDL